MSTTVRVHTSVRDDLRQIHLGKTHSRTLAALAGRYEATPTSVSTATIGPSKETTVTVSNGGHAVLTRLKDDMDVAALGDVVAVLVAGKRP